MDNTARIDRKRLAMINERDPTTASAPSLRAKRKRTSGSAEAAPTALPQADPPNPPEATRATPPKPRKTPPPKAMPADSERIPAATNAVTAAPGALKMAPLSASGSKPPGQAAPPAPPARSAAAGETDGLRAQFPIPDAEALARNIGQAIEQGGEVLAAYLRPRETGEIKMNLADDGGEMARSIGQLGQYYMSNPLAAFEAQTAQTMQFINLWASTLQRFLGAPAALVATPGRPDKRFSDAEWRDNPYFDFIKQAYVLTTHWADDLITRADEMDPHERDKAQFYLRQVTAALSPSNFVGTNPELLRMTLQESGENLVRGLKMMAEDIEAGKGNLRIRQVDARDFQLGVNMANTPGKVIFRNDLIELIQYAPTTPDVYKRPLLIAPPWINKFYILDLNPEKSFIRWAVTQGLTVFVISWVNPDERLADKGFEAYMREGIITALGLPRTGDRRA